VAETARYGKYGYGLSFILFFVRPITCYKD